MNPQFVARGAQSHVVKAYQPMRLAATNVWCWRWRGITRSVHVNKGLETINARAELVLQLAHPAGGPDVNPGVEDYQVVSGTAVAWIWPSPGAACDCPSGPVTQAIKHEDAFIALHTADTGKLRRLYLGGRQHRARPPSRHRLLGGR